MCDVDIPRPVLNGYFIYGCDDCKQGFRMFVEHGLEEKDDGDKHKPVPFIIKCPFCGKNNCKDVSFKKIPCSVGIYATDNHPYFANVEGDDCGKPMHMDRARVEYRRS